MASKWTNVLLLSVILHFANSFHGLAPDLEPPLIDTLAKPPEGANKDDEIAKITKIFGAEPDAAGGGGGEFDFALPVDPLDCDEDGKVDGECGKGKLAGEVSKDQKELQDQVEALAKLLSHAKKIKNLIPEKEKKLEELKAKLGVAKDLMKKKGAAKQLDETKKELEANNKKIAELEAKLAELKAKKTELEAKIAKLGGALEGGESGGASGAAGATGAPDGADGKGTAEGGGEGKGTAEGDDAGKGTAEAGAEGTGDAGKGTAEAGAEGTGDAGKGSAEGTAEGTGKGDGKGDAKGKGLFVEKDSKSARKKRMVAALVRQLGNLLGGISDSNNDKLGLGRKV